MVQRYHDLEGDIWSIESSESILWILNTTALRRFPAVDRLKYSVKQENLQRAQLVLVALRSIFAAFCSEMFRVLHDGV